MINKYILCFQNCRVLCFKSNRGFDWHKASTCTNRRRCINRFTCNLGKCDFLLHCTLLGDRFPSTGNTYRDAHLEMYWLTCVVSVVMVAEYIQAAQVHTTTKEFFISGNKAGVNNTCGKGFTLAAQSTENVTLTMNGLAPQGLCTVNIVTSNSQRCEDTICVQSTDIENSGVTITVDSYDRNEVRATKTFQGPNYQELENRYCVNGYRITLTIREPVNTAQTFNFQLFVQPTCNDTSNAELLRSSNADAVKIDTKQQIKDAVLKNTIEGVITGVSLAIMFLIILAITYCYYRSYPYSNKKRQKRKSKKQTPSTNNEQELKEIRVMEQNRGSSGKDLLDADEIDLDPVDETATLTITTDKEDNTKADNFDEINLSSPVEERHSASLHSD